VTLTVEDLELPGLVATLERLVGRFGYEGRLRGADRGVERWL